MVKGRKGRKAGRQAGRQEGQDTAVRSCLSALLPFCLSALPLILIVSGCAHAQAKTTPDMPALEVPAPPPRDAEPNETEAPQPVPLVAEPARNTPSRPRPVTREPVKPDPPKVEPPKPEPPPVEPPKPVEELPKAPPTLQTTPATAEGEMERGIRASLVRATADLNRIDYRALNADARTQYDTAKRFARQADDAMRMKNLVFAKNLADKAATLAAQLAGR
jgi:outer membrane biosynthesis protein TonB